LYNSVLSGISLDGKKFLYTNPLAYADEMPFQQRWSKDRVPYISLSNCCPPNVVRTISEVSNYVYSLSDKGLYVNLYGGSDLHTKWTDGTSIMVSQQTAYPWDGMVKLTIQQAPSAFSFFLRIPGWAKGAKINVNGRPFSGRITEGSYVELKQTWKKGDVIQLFLPMDAKLIEANPLVEETRNQVAVKRGPVVYCLEAIDLPKKQDVFGVVLPSSIQFTTETKKVGTATMVFLKGTAKTLREENWNDELYKELSNKATTIPIQLVPYFAWGNRGHTDMSVWLAVSK
jgi:DUF1680 family protein